MFFAIEVMSWAVVPMRESICPLRVCSVESYPWSWLASAWACDRTTCRGAVDEGEFAMSCTAFAKACSVADRPLCVSENILSTCAASVANSFERW